VRVTPDTPFQPEAGAQQGDRADPRFGTCSLGCATTRTAVLLGPSTIANGRSSFWFLWVDRRPHSTEIQAHCRRIPAPAHRRLKGLRHQARRRHAIAPTNRAAPRDVMPGTCRDAGFMSGGCLRSGRLARCQRADRASVARAGSFPIATGTGGGLGPCPKRFLVSGRGKGGRLPRLLKR